VQRGLSLVELMIGSAVALTVVAAGTTVLLGNFKEGHALRLETRLLQELRSAADVVGRDLRRAGYWGSAESGVWSAGAASVAVNPYTELVPAAAASDEVSFRLSRDATEDGAVALDEQYGFRLRAGTIELQLGRGNWQALTDRTTLVVQTFRVTPHVAEISLESYCAQACPPASPTCPPRQQVRSVDVEISARSTLDPRVVRSLQTSVRLRNDRVFGSCT
jgi:type IV pilus assembly protein PilW